MRTFWMAGVVLCLAAAVAAGHAGPGAADAGAVLAAARDALGGDGKLSAVKSFVATGRTRQVRGNNLVPIEFELYCELPDRYVRKDEIPAQESGPTASGFNGDGLIQIPPPTTPPATPAAARPVAPGAAVPTSHAPGAATPARAAGPPPTPGRPGSPPSSRTSSS